MPSLDLTLKPAAATAFGDYTLAHVNEYFAIVVDGIVVAVPVINGPITGGEVTISAGSQGSDTFSESAAILVGGLLPEEWRDAVAPEILSRDAAVEKARASMLRSGVDGAAEATVESADLDANQGDRGWEPIWTVVFDRENNGPMQVIVDARPGQ